jgi:multidrug efflux pump subunit AcrA (membrane-fusion protein)
MIELLSTFEAGGIVQAGTTAHITSRVIAPILAVHVHVGDHVTRGQTLVTLDAREVAANAARASAALTSATEAARAADARTVTAEATRRLAEATHGRIRGLFDKRSATPQELDQSVAAFGAAEAQVATARAESAAAIAARDSAHAAADAAAVARSYAVLTAPFDGVVASRLADPGSLAAPGTLLLVVEESGPNRLEVRLDESRAARTTVGEKADVRLDADRAASWLPATVVEIGRADSASHSMLIKLQLPSGATARTGSFGRARFRGEPHRTLVVPSTSVIRRSGLTFVFAVDAGNQVRLRPVVAGTVDGDRTEILAGVSAGDAVVVSPPATLTDGSHVTESPAAGAAQERRYD